MQALNGIRPRLVTPVIESPEGWGEYVFAHPSHTDVGNVFPTHAEAAIWVDAECRRINREIVGAVERAKGLLRKYGEAA